MLTHGRPWTSCQIECDPTTHSLPVSLFSLLTLQLNITVFLQHNITMEILSHSEQESGNSTYLQPYILHMVLSNL